MRVILDASEVYERWGSSFRYFNSLIPRLNRFPEVHLDVIPSPTNALSTKDGSATQGGPTRPTMSWFPQGKLRSWMGLQKKNLKKLWQMKASGSSEPTLFHSYYYTLPPDRNVPYLSYYHDIIPELFRDEFNAAYYPDLISRKEKSVRRAEFILSNSHKTKADLCGLYGIPESKVDVVYFGIERDFFAERHKEAEAAAFRQQHSLPEHFLFYVGARLQHKNFVRWAEAYSKFAGRKDYAFVVAGSTWESQEVEMFKKLGIKPKLITLPDEPALRMLYQLCDVFVYPSLYEGMGLPPLEAQASGAVVAAAKAGAIPEVTGEGAEYFNPRDIDDMNRAVERCLDPAVRKQLLEKGSANVSKYSWEGAAEKTVAAYRKILG